MMMMMKTMNILILFLPVVIRFGLYSTASLTTATTTTTTTMIVLLLSAQTTTAQQQQQQQQDPNNNDHRIQIPIETYQKVIEFVLKEDVDEVTTKTKTTSKDEIIDLLEQRDVHTLYRVAKAMNNNNDNIDVLDSSGSRRTYKQTALEIFHALADTSNNNNAAAAADDDDNNNNGHVLSQLALGFEYAAAAEATAEAEAEAGRNNDNGSIINKRRAISYFIQAGENGPHQVGLYNAGRLLVEEGDYVKALAYIRAAYTVHQSNNPKYATSTPKLTETSLIAYKILSEQLVTAIQTSMKNKNKQDDDDGNVVTIQQAADMFLYANINDYPSPGSTDEIVWTTVMHSMQKKDWDGALEGINKLRRPVPGSRSRDGDNNKKLSELQLTILHMLQDYCQTVVYGDSRGGEL